MDLDDQANVNRLAEESQPGSMVVVLGQPDPVSAALFAETVTRGDPTWAGPLAGVPLGLPIVHIFEPAVKAQVAAEVYEAQVTLMEMSLDTAGIVAAIEDVRVEAPGAA